MNNTIYEKDFTEEQISEIHSFGECWINDYNRNIPQHFRKALWLFAWDKVVVFK